MIQHFHLPFFFLIAGVIKTELTRYMEPFMAAEAAKVGDWFVKLNQVIAAVFDLALFTQADGALTQLHLATSLEPPVNGGFYHPIGQLVRSSHPDGEDVKKQKELWRQTELAIMVVKDKE